MGWVFQPVPSLGAQCRPPLSALICVMGLKTPLHHPPGPPQYWPSVQSEVTLQGLAFSLCFQAMVQRVHLCNWALEIRGLRSPNTCFIKGSSSHHQKNDIFLYLPPAPELIRFTPCTLSLRTQTPSPVQHFIRTYSLKWPPVTQRFAFLLHTLTFKCRHHLRIMTHPVGSHIFLLVPQLQNGTTSK